MSKNDLQQSFLAVNKKYDLNHYPSPLEKYKFKDHVINLKRDDLLTLGCSKQRSIVYMIEEYLKKGQNKFAVASSGNAALVAAYCALNNDSVKEVKILLSGHDKLGISDNKLNKFITVLNLDATIEDIRNGLKYKNIEFILSDNPKQMAFGLGNEGYINLRGSTDDLAIEGFKTIAYELNEQLANIDAVFIPASSGTTAEGVYLGFNEIGLNPQIHIVQTTKVYTLVKKIVGEVKQEIAHPAESIIDIIGHRKKSILDIIELTKGGAWVINSNEARIVKGELESFGIKTSFDSSLTLAAYKQAIKKHQFNNPVLLCTG